MPKFLVYVEAVEIGHMVVEARDFEAAAQYTRCNLEETTWPDPYQADVDVTDVEYYDGDEEAVNHEEVS